MKTLRKLTKQEFINASHRDLADLTGIPIATWSAYFNKRNSPTLKTLKIIAEKLNMELIDLIIAFEQRCDLYADR